MENLKIPDICNDQNYLSLTPNSKLSNTTISENYELTSESGSRFDLYSDNVSESDLFTSYDNNTSCLDPNLSNLGLEESDKVISESMEIETPDYEELSKMNLSIVSREEFGNESSNYGQFEFEDYFKETNND